MSTPDTLLAYVLERLPKPGDAHYIQQLEKIAQGSGVPIHTLIKIAKGETEDPRVSTVQHLHDYLRGQERAAA